MKFTDQKTKNLLLMRLLIFIFLLSIVIFIDLYVYYGIKTSMGSHGKIAIALYVLSVLLTIGGIVNILIKMRNGFNTPTWGTNFLFGLSFTIIATKLVFAAILLGEDFFRTSKYILAKFSSDSTPIFENRRKFVAQMGLLVAAVPFSSFLYGITKGKYNFKVKHEVLKFPNLPKAFNGFKIAQISDVHAGTFDDFDAVQRGVSLIQEQMADIIVFTGDLVNNVAEEIDPYLALFGSLNAPLGKYSILGNHDYGDYAKWLSKEAKDNNLNQLMENHKTMGFKLLLNEGVRINKDENSLFLGGVENWGKPPFPQKGDLNKTFQDANQKDFNILLSHDPSHWDLQVLDFQKPIHLTMSGHTHGMQMGIEIPGIKWSPAKYRYPKWAGLYEDAGKYLYINRGFGFLGFPGRAGIWPEITVIELQTA